MIFITIFPIFEYRVSLMSLWGQGTQVESTCKESQEGQETITNRESGVEEEAVGLLSLASSPVIHKVFIMDISCVS